MKVYIHTSGGDYNMVLEYPQITNDKENAGLYVALAGIKQVGGYIYRGLAGVELLVPFDKIEYISEEK